MHGDLHAGLVFFQYVQWSRDDSAVVELDSIV
jgi:hypothetical protein